ncbi:hypothetical protein ACJMK2_036054 [Sinanodonta woodiana]|uniref:Proton-coupled folate transporter n=1 Tax=Sinanodonta woodiana TaxID=1069815 RepID=A0ABD3WFZ9_SINWO
MASSPQADINSLLRKTQKCGLGFLAVVQSYLVEFAYFTFFLARHMSLPLFQEYVQSEIHKQKHLQSSNTLNQTAKPSHDLQRESAYTILSLQIAEGLPAVVIVIILGAVSDRTGRRKILLWLPSLGSCIYSLIFILVQYTGWSLDGLFMASAIRGLSGSMTAFLAGSSYYAINSVKPNQRSSRLALQELLNGAAYAIGNIMVGYWVRDAGFLQPFWFTFILSLMTFLVAFFLVQEVKTDNNNRSERYLNTGNCCVDTFKPLGRFFRCCNNKDLIRIWLAILAFQTYAVVHLGQINVLVLYFLGPPMSWPSVKIGIFLSVLMAVAAIGTGMVPPFLRNYVTDTNITFAGYLSKAIGTLWIAVIQNDTVIYFALMLLVLELLPFPMLRSIVSKGVEPSEQGSLFSLMHCGESISYFLAPLVFQSIYGNTLHFYSGFIFVISVMLLVLPVGFTM